MFKQLSNNNSYNKNLSGIITKIFNGVKTHQADIVLAISIALICIISFNLGKMSVLKNTKPPITITNPADINTATNPAISTAAKSAVARDPTVVASKNSKLYHFTWCPGASQIADKNKLTFSNEAAAIAAGLTLASNCNR